MQGVGGRALSQADITQVLPSLTMPGSSINPRVIGETGLRRRWREIDPRLLHRKAEEDGIPCKRLDELTEKAYEKFGKELSG